MIGRGEQLRFALEAREPVGILGGRGEQHLDRDVAPEAGVARPIDLAHRPRAELRGDLVGAQPCTAHRALPVCRSTLGEVGSVGGGLYPAILDSLGRAARLLELE